MCSFVRLNWEQAISQFELLCVQQRVDDIPRIKSLDDLVLIALDERFTVNVSAAFREIFLEIQARWFEIKPDDQSSVIFAALTRTSSSFPAGDALIQRFLEQRKGKLLKDESRIELDLCSIYRLFVHKRSRFVSFFAVGDFRPFLKHDCSYIRCLTKNVLSLYVMASERMLNQWLAEEKPEDVEKLQLLTVGETQQAANMASKLSNAQLYEQSRFELVPSSFIANVGGVLMARKDFFQNENLGFVKTTTARLTFRKIAGGLLTERALLVTGAPGCGKTFCLESIFKILRPSTEIVRIHPSSQMDVKTLLGTYTTGEKPGSFEWRAGILTSAVTIGKCLLIEDLDQAPEDFLSVLLPLVETRKLHIPSRNQIIDANAGFQLLATITMRGVSSPSFMGKRLWYEITMDAMSDSDIGQIINEHHPSVKILTPKLVHLFRDLENLHSKNGFCSARQVVTRDLFKLASRSEVLLQKAIGISEGNIPNFVYDDLFREAVYSFAGFISDRKLHANTVELIAKNFEIGNAMQKSLLVHHKPLLTILDSEIFIGRAKIQKRSTFGQANIGQHDKFKTPIVLTKHNLRLLENVAVSVAQNESVLLVGETGTGKTSMVQYLAQLTNHKLIVVNLSQQVETGDLVGSLKPVDARMLAGQLMQEFNDLFDITFNRTKNHKFLEVLSAAARKSKWDHVVKFWKEAYRLAKHYNSAAGIAPARKRQKLDAGDIRAWEAFMSKVDSFSARWKEFVKSVLFQYIEGLLVKAARQGYWILLDEINLAPPETLEEISDLLVEPRSITLLESSDNENSVIRAHSEFRLFACMNPSTDVGKRDLPLAIRSCFTELYVDSPEKDVEDLRLIIRNYLQAHVWNDEPAINDVADIYINMKNLAASHAITDGAGQTPHFSLRTLAVALSYSSSVCKIYGLRRSLYEGISMSFLTVLGHQSYSLLEPIVRNKLLQSDSNAELYLSLTPAAPPNVDDFVQYKHLWLPKGPLPIEVDSSYILTPSVERNLMNLARATLMKRFPVLIQGPTSTGKTSMIKYLAKMTGYKLVRINNHEHTDLQEYFGFYVTDSNGSLVFQEGILVEAVRNGFWIVLDELNLAPTDILEALNRLLDDNRELLIPETQEVLKPHPNFMLFATQNPPGIYAGRKMLSRAFRNRFLELHYDEIPQAELETILTGRCKIAPSYARKIVCVYEDLARQRHSSRIFEERCSFATLRDLFRWGSWEASSYEELALNGFMLLCERVRESGEKDVVKSVIENTMRVKLNVDYSLLLPPVVLDLCPNIVWTSGMKRLVVLVMKALEQNEPVLLVGETGCGKTTVCDIIARLLRRKLHILNAHQNMETGDIIGSHRPIRNRPEKSQMLKNLLQDVLKTTENDLETLKSLYVKKITQSAGEKSTWSEEQQSRINYLIQQNEALFEWNDGSLVTAMKHGDLFLLDEISLADDSVLERLNSVLEPERTLLLPEKGGRDIFVKAVNNFELVATMNPGGDYGKKELSPALRNRFTEFWVPSMDNYDDVMMVVNSKLCHNVKKYASVIVQFCYWFASVFGNQTATSGFVSLRDVLDWVQFINVMTNRGMDPLMAVFHGACMVFIDSVGTNTLSYLSQNVYLRDSRQKCINKMSQLLDAGSEVQLLKVYFDMPHVCIDEASIQIGPFKESRFEGETFKKNFSLAAPTTARNAMRVLRAFNIQKPILLEGSPGVGKTSLVQSLAYLMGRKLTRINLSDQTDLVELFGSDMPVEGESAGLFGWRDAPFLKAMQEGSWVLLDEMNLAPQAVLEGLNSCLDHRGEVYIPELSRTFKCHPDFMVFAAQNPHQQGGGRKGLPKSFVNRFSAVYMDELSQEDYKVIIRQLFSQIEERTVTKIIAFMQDVDNSVNDMRIIGHAGAPFEFNLRDIMRWCTLLCHSGLPPSEFLDLIVLQRFRTEEDRKVVTEIFERHFGKKDVRHLIYSISDSYFRVGHIDVDRCSRIFANDDLPLFHLLCNKSLVESSLTCIDAGWPLILVGPENSGKSTLVRYLAYIYGRPLKQYFMNSAVDSTDLLGEFDQIEASQQLARIWFEIENFLLSHVSLLDEGSLNMIEAFDRHDLDIVHSILQDIPEAQNVVQMIKTYKSSDFSKPRFEWLDGVLLQAVEKGFWIVLENANLCHPSVLDRLNSLLEPGGYLLVNECSEINGKPRKVFSHPEFRIFLTVDPKYGELSRAMRNRGIELYMDNLEKRASAFDRNILQLPQERFNGLESQFSVLNLKPQFCYTSFLPTDKVNELPIIKTMDVVSLFNVDLYWPVYGIASTLNTIYFDTQKWCSDTNLASKLAKLGKAAVHQDFRQFSAICELIEQPSSKLSKGSNTCVLLSLNPSLALKLKTAYKIYQSRGIILDSLEEIGRLKDKQLNLLQLSFLSRTKESIECIDVYGFLSVCLNTDAILEGDIGFASVLFDFVNFVTQTSHDLSRLSIFCELWDACVEKSYSPVIRQAVQKLRTQAGVDNSQNALEKLWNYDYSGGFPSETQWAKHEELLRFSEKFDAVIPKIGIRDIEKTADLRKILSYTMKSLHEVNPPIKKYEDLESKLNALNAILDSQAIVPERNFSDLSASLGKRLVMALIANSDPYILNHLYTISCLSNWSTKYISTLCWHSYDSLYVPKLPQGKWNLTGSLLLSATRLKKLKAFNFKTAITEARLIAKSLVACSSVFSQDIFSDIRRILVRCLEKLRSVCPSVIAPNADTISRQTPGNDLSKLWIQYAGVLLDCFINNSFIDPATRQHVLFERYKNHLQEYRKDIDLWGHVRQIFCGDDPTPTDTMLDRQLCDLKVVEIPNVFRPLVSKLTEIQDKISSIAGIVNANYIADLSKAEYENWTISLTKFLESLDQYTPYEDLLKILRSAIHSLQLGLELKFSSTSPMSLRHLMNPMMILSLDQFLVYGESLLLQNTTSDSPKHSVLLQLLRCCVLHGYNKVPELVEKILELVFNNWKMRESLKEKELSSKNCIFRYDSPDVDDEELSLKKMFPDYNDNAMSNDDQTARNKNVRDLCQVYSNLFSGDVNISDFPNILNLAADLQPDSSDLFNYGDISTIPVAFMNFNLKLNFSETTSLQFYKDSCVLETQKAVEIAIKVMERFKCFQKQWPENEFLISIQNLCEKIFNLSVNAPIAQNLELIDELFELLSEWNQSAPSGAHVPDLVSISTALIIRWRRLELRSWQTLFENEKLEIIMESANYWYHLYEILLWNPVHLAMDDQDSESLTQNLILFLSNSSFGDFNFRVSMLKAFHGHMKQHSKVPAKLADIVANVLGFFEQYEIPIEDHMKSLQKPLQEKLKELILLASWRDTSVFALKITAQKSYHDLHNVVAKYRDIVRESVTQVVSRAVSEKVFEAPVLLPVRDRYVDATLYSEFLSKNYQTEKLWNQKSVVIRECEKRGEDIRRYCVNVDNLDLPKLSSIAKQAVNEARRLRTQTPSVLNADTKKTVASLKMEKGRVFAEILKLLKNVGLGSRVGNEHFTKSSVFGVLTKTKPLSGRQFDAINQYFYRILELMPRLRAAVQDPNPDVPRQELSKGMRYGENLLNFILLQRHIAHSSYVNVADTLNHAIGRLNEVRSLFVNGECLLGSDSFAPRAKINIVQISKGMVAFLKMLDQNPDLTVNSHLEKIEELLKTADVLQIKTDRWSREIDDIQAETVQLAADIAKAKEGPLRLAEPLLREWVSAFSKCREESKARFSIELLDQQATKLCKIILVATQNIAKLCFTSIDETRWLHYTISFVNSLSTSLHSHEIVRQLELFEEQCFCASTPENTKVVAAYVGYVMPFVLGYQSLFETVQSDFCKYHHDFIQSSYSLLKLLLEISSEGFCSPSQVDDEISDNSELSHGMGLGDGSGEATSKNTGEMDGDLMEAAQTNNEEASNSSDDSQGSDNVHDIDGDMAGNIEDLENSDAENSDGSQSDASETIDDELGNIDELDPNAVDEKMWDDSSWDAPKEKQTEEHVQGEADDDNVISENHMDQNQPAHEQNIEKSSPARSENECNEEEDSPMQEEKESKEQLEDNIPREDILNLSDDIQFEGDNDIKSDTDKSNISDQDSDYLGSEVEGSVEDIANSDDAEAEELPEKSTAIPNEEYDQGSENDAQSVKSEASFSQSDIEARKSDVEDSMPELTNPQEAPKDTLDSASKSREKDNKDFEISADNIIDQEMENGDQDSRQGTLGGRPSQYANGLDDDEENQQQMDDVPSPTTQNHSDSKLANANFEHAFDKDANDALKELGNTMEDIYQGLKIYEANVSQKIQEDESHQNLPDKYDVRHIGVGETPDTQALGKALDTRNEEVIDLSKLVDFSSSDDDAVIDLPEHQAELAQSANFSEKDPEMSRNEPEGSHSVVGSKSNQLEYPQTFESSISPISPKNLGKEMDRQSMTVNDSSLDDARQRWRAYDSFIQDSALVLSEQLRLILEPTVATKLRGDYKTGKRLNMKRIIPYIASQYKRDKIWLRRTKPSKRDFRILISLDDSKSMNKKEVIDLAFQSVALVCKALTLINAGDIAIARFGESAEIVHDFGQYFNFESGVDLVRGFEFNQHQTDILELIKKSLGWFENIAGQGTNELNWHLHVIVSDGLCEKSEEILRLVREARDRHIMIVFIVLDAINQNGSILDLDQVVYDKDFSGKPTLKMERYMDSFPFEYFVIVRQIRDLPSILSSVLKQFFQTVE